MLYMAVGVSYIKRTLHSTTQCCVHSFFINKHSKKKSFQNFFFGLTVARDSLASKLTAVIPTSFLTPSFSLVITENASIDLNETTPFLPKKTHSVVVFYRLPTLKVSRECEMVFHDDLGKKRG